MALTEAQSHGVCSMLDVKIDPLPWWDRLRARFTVARGRSRTECHRRLVAALVEFRLNDYEKMVTRVGEGDRRKVVRYEMGEILSGDAYLEKSGEELARAIEEGIQVRMADEILWHQIACLNHAGRFAQDAHLTVNTVNPQHFSTTAIPAISKCFPFLTQPIKAVPPASPRQLPTEWRLSDALTNLLRQWLGSHALPTMRYKFGPHPGPQDLVSLSILSEGDPAVVTVPMGWHPAGNQMEGTHDNSAKPC